MPTPTETIAEAIIESGLPLADQRGIIMHLHRTGRWNSKTIDICLDRAIAIARWREVSRLTRTARKA